MPASMAGPADASESELAPRASVRPVPRPAPEARDRVHISTKAVAAPPVPQVAVKPLDAAMSALRRGDWDAALAFAGEDGPVARDIVEWHRLRSGKGRFDEVLAFLERRPDWPGLPYLRKRSEGAVPYRARPDEVIAFFAETPPQTGAGMIVLAAAHEETGDGATARDLIVRAWREFPLSTGDEGYILERYRDLVADHHVARLDMLLWEGDEKAARRLMTRVPEGWRKLAEARIALSGSGGNVDTLIAAVPAALADNPGLAYERFAWRLRKGRRDEAAELMLSRPGTEAGLGRAGAWSNWRRILAREAMRDGNPKRAYRLAAAHGLGSGPDADDEGSHYADLEWLAGYLALRYLDDPALALTHFRRFRASVETPISLGRAGYWEGRAHEAMGDAEAAAMAYAFGAEYQTSFYGLLAAERAGLPMDPALAGKDVYPDWRTASFRSSSVFEAAERLDAIGERDLAERFLTHLAESLSPADMGALADYAATLGDPHLEVMIGKRAATMGVVLPRAYFPVIDFRIGDLPVPEELALAIARRESEFDPGVRSGAGAMGLMQVMPGTARDVSREIGIAYSASRLLEDPAYNARLGTAYLQGLIDRFGGNMALVAAGYNAGPGRPIQWMEAYGDPRAANVDPVDWIEHIPFRETRNYVMRVMESLPIYRARISGETAPLRMLSELKAR